MSSPVHVLTWPQPLELEHALGVLRALASDVRRQPVTFEARARGGRVRYSVRGLGRTALDRLQGHVPNLRITTEQAQVKPLRRAARLRLRHPSRPLDVGDPVVSVRTVLAGLISAAPNEDVVVQVMLGRGRSPYTVPASVANPWQGWMSRATVGAQPTEPTVRTKLQARANEHLLRADIRFATSASGHHAENAIRGLLAASRIIERDGPRFILSAVKIPDVVHAVPPRRFPLTLTVRETVVMLGLPVGKDTLPGQPPAHPRIVLPRGEVSAERPFATLATDRSVLVGLPFAESRFPTHALGPTGSGKSTAILSLAVADFASGQSVAMIDPKADTASAALERIPRNRLDDVVVLDPSAVDPVRWNPLSSAGRDPHVVADCVVDILAEVFAPIGPRTFDVLNSAVLTLVLTGGTLTELPDLLLEPTVRRERVAHLTDPVLLGFWARYNQYKPAQVLDVVGPTMTRLRRVLLRPGLRAMLGAGDGFTIEELFSRPTILLVPTNRGVIGPQVASLLGSLVIATLWNRVLAQAALPETRRKPLTVYVDEMQDYLRLPGGDLSDALAQSRSLNTRWVLANQYLGQLPREMQAAVETNALNKICFALSATDAKVMAGTSAQLEAEDFRSLDTFEIYARLTKNGTPEPWISARTLPPPPVTSDPVEVLVRSRARYASAPEPDKPITANPKTTSSKAPEPMTPVGRTPRRRS